MAQLPATPERRLQPTTQPGVPVAGMAAPASGMSISTVGGAQSGDAMIPPSAPTMQTFGGMPSNPGAPGAAGKPPMPAMPSPTGVSGPNAPTPANPAGPYSAPSRGVGVGSGGASPQQLAGFDQFADSAYEQAQRRLDPRFAQAENQFRQRMVNQGISEGTEAFDNAWANFSMDRNDAYSQAQNQALAQALAAQGQAFGQGFQDRSLAQSGRQFDQQLGYNYAGLNEQTRQFDNQFNFQGQRADMQDLMALLGYGQGVNQNNNNLLNQDFNRAGGLFGLVPGMAPTQVDVLGPYQMQQQAAAQANAQAGNASNGFFGALGQLGSAYISSPFFPSDERLKTDIRRVGVLDNGLPVYAYRYKHGGPTMLGVMAQEVLETKPEAVADLGGWLAVDYDKAVA